MNNTRRPGTTVPLWEIVHAARRMELHASTLHLFHEDPGLGADLRLAARVLRQCAADEQRVYGLDVEEAERQAVEYERCRRGKSVNKDPDVEGF